MPLISHVFTAIFFNQFSCFCITEGHLNFFSSENGIFNDVTITLAILTEKEILKISF